LKTYNVAVAFNKLYLQHACVTIISLLENNKELDFKIYIIFDGLNNNDQNMMRELVKNYRCKLVFLEVDESFKQNDYSRGLNRLNHFLVAELSNIYIDICKDKMYCDGKNSDTRIASQSAMAMILKALLHTLAPILTYTMDEIVEYAPKIIKGDAKNIFDIQKYTLPEVEADINEQVLLEAKEKFSEIKDNLTKQKVIKSTLELVIYTDSKDILELDSTLAEDWFVVSKVIKHTEDNALASFEVVKAKKRLLKDLFAEKRIDVLFSNQDEAKVYTGADEENSLDIFSRRCRIVAVKLGNRLYIRKKFNHKIRLCPAEKPVRIINSRETPEELGKVLDRLNSVTTKENN
jgi:isoleucyl-tRNA synthetase